MDCKKSVLILCCKHKTLARINIPLVKILHNFFYATMLTYEFQGSLSPNTYSNQDQSPTNIKMAVDFGPILLMYNEDLSRFKNGNNINSTQFRCTISKTKIQLTLIYFLVNRNMHFKSYMVNANNIL